MKTQAPSRLSTDAFLNLNGRLGLFRGIAVARVDLCVVRAAHFWKILVLRRGWWGGFQKLKQQFGLFWNKNRLLNAFYIFQMVPMVAIENYEQSWKIGTGAYLNLKG